MRERSILSTLAIGATTLLIGTAAAEARPVRERHHAPAPVWREQIPQRWDRGRGMDLYSREPGTEGIITATTPNQWGNLGGPSTGGGNGSP